MKRKQNSHKEADGVLSFPLPQPLPAPGSHPLKGGWGAVLQGQLPHFLVCVLPLLSLSGGRNGRPQGWLLCFKVRHEPCDARVLCPGPVALLPSLGTGHVH